MPTPRTSRKAVASLVLIALCLLLPASPVAALAFPVGVTGLVLGFIGLGDIRRSEGRLQGRRLAVAAILSYGVLFCTGLLWAPCSQVREAQRRMKCANRLKTLASAMHEYNEDHGTLPPHAIYDGEGRPLLSWRVLLLPYLGEAELYEAFRLDEPWDGPHNAALLARRPEVFAAPGYWPGDGPHGTFFQVFVGPGAAFEGRKGMKLSDDFPDGLSNTILIAEAGEAVPWTAPADLPYAPDKPLPKLGGLRLREAMFMVALADGSVREIRVTNEETIRAAITRNGDDRPGRDW
jgi:hypothetical protein